MLEALIELVQEQNPGRIQIGERCAMGADTMEAMRVCGIVDVAEEDLPVTLELLIYSQFIALVVAIHRFCRLTRTDTAPASSVSSG